MLPINLLIIKLSVKTNISTNYAFLSHTSQINISLFVRHRVGQTQLSFYLLWIPSLYFISVYLHINVWEYVIGTHVYCGICICEWICRKQRRCWVSWSINIQVISLRHGFSLNLELNWKPEKFSCPALSVSHRAGVYRYARLYPVLFVDYEV